MRLVSPGHHWRRIGPGIGRTGQLLANIGESLGNADESGARLPRHGSQTGQLSLEIATGHWPELYAVGSGPVNRWLRATIPDTLQAMSERRAHPNEEVEPSIAVGCCELPAQMGRRKYFERLPLLETRFPSDEIPLDRVLDRWRKEAGRPGGFSIVAPRDLCDLTKIEDLRTERSRVTVLANAARRIDAAAVVFLTPSTLSPGAAHRALLSQFFTDIATEEAFSGLLRVWQPDGLWQPNITAHVARELGVISAFDPLAADPLEEGPPPPPTEVAYARVGGLGRGPRPLSPDEMASLAEWIQACPRAFVTFDTPSKWRDARAFARWLGASDDRTPN